VLQKKQYERNSKQLKFILNQINVIIIVTNIIRKNIYLGFFKFYQPKATGGGFLIFEWTLLINLKLVKFVKDKKIFGK
jgi:RecA/RadA recombinase